MKPSLLCRIGLHAFGARMPALVPNRERPREVLMGWREECRREHCEAVRLTELFGRAVRS